MRNEEKVKWLSVNAISFTPTYILACFLCRLEQIVCDLNTLGNESQYCFGYILLSFADINSQYKEPNTLFTHSSK